MKLKIAIFLAFVFTLALFNPESALAGYKTQSIIPSSYENYGTAQDLVMLADGKIWYADSLNQRLVKIDPDTNEILRTIGRSGSDEGEFDHELRSITLDPEGNLYALDECHVFKFDSNGGFIQSWGGCGDTPGTSEMSIARSIYYDEISNLLLVTDSIHDRVVKFSLDGEYVDEFGSTGTALGQLDGPHGITTDSSGKIYVVDSNNSRVQVFTNDGVALLEMGSADPGDDELIAASDVEVMSNGDIIVTSQNAPEVVRFSSSGEFVSSWGSNGTGESQFTGPRYMTQTVDETLWITDPGQHRMQHFDNDGTFIKTIGNRFNTAGKFIAPHSLDFDNSGNIYVLDSTRRVQKFNSSGTYISTVIAADEGHIGDGAYHIAISPVTQNIFVSQNGTVAVFNNSGTFLNFLGNEAGSGGTDPGEFDQARGMDFDSAGNVYVADMVNNRVQKFDPSLISDADFYNTEDGGFLLEFGSAFDVPEVAEDGKFNRPNHIAVDEDDNIYVTEESNGSVSRVQSFNTSGVFQEVVLEKWDTGNPDQYYIVGGFYVDGDGKYYLTDHYYSRIQIYDTDGSLLETVGSGGGGEEQFNEPASGKLNPATGDLVVIDGLNNRVHIMFEGNKILNLISSADVLDTSNSSSVVRTAVDPSDPDIENLDAQLFFGDYLISDFTLDLSSDRDWVAVNATTLYAESKSLIVNLNPDDAPGVSATHSLYIPYQTGQTYVHVCPEATLIAEVAEGCTDGYTLNDGDSGLSKVVVASKTYWKIQGLTGTGGFSPVPDPVPDSGSSGGSSSGSGSSFSAGNPSCNAGVPSSTPSLFQVNVTGSTAKLFFTPIANTNTFFVSFSTKPLAEEHAVVATLAREGVQNFTVGHLKPNTTYYFKVRGQIDCMPGRWSNVMKITTRGKGVTKPVPFYQYQAVKKTIKR